VNTSLNYATLARQLSTLFALLPQVKAIALGCSLTSGIIDQNSDIDLYVYTQADIPLEERQVIVTQSGGASQANLGMTYWGQGDEWYHAPTGIEVDIVYFDTQWMVDQIHRVIGQNEASLGYTTCLWHTVRNAQVLYDPQGWLQTLQKKASADYPDRLQRNIIGLNHPVLREVVPAYTNQLTKAVKRHDIVSVNHRLTALLASYFDIIFAVNRVLHPGEKKLMDLALSRCESLPQDFAIEVPKVLQSSCLADQAFLVNVTRLLDHLDQWLEQKGFSAALTPSQSS
jgi:hypothetical protein